MNASRYIRSSLFFFCFALLQPLCRAEESAAAYVTPSFTHSPDGRYGIMLPVFENATENEPDTRLNKVVNLVSKQVVSTINAEPGFDRRLNFREVAPPKWSADSSVLLWKVEGKWFPTALVLLHIADGKQEWQLDLLKTAQEEILARTRKAVPERYAAAKKANAGNGSAYPDGFTVDVVQDGANDDTVSLPMRFHVTLTADPKEIEDFPANLDSSLEATVTKDGKFVVNAFRIDKQKK